MNPFIIKAGIAVITSIVVYLIWNTQSNREKQQQSYKSNFDGENIRVCCVCLNDLQPRNAITQLPCKHRFHKGCISEVFRNEVYRGRLCPLCRTPISESFISELF